MKSTTKPADRQARAYKEAGSYLVMPASIEGNDWWVNKRNGGTYTVDLTAGTCDCPDHTRRKVACKHIHLAQFHAEAEAPQQERLPEPAPQANHAAQDARVARDRATIWAEWA